MDENTGQDTLSAALDAMSTGELLALAAVFAEMREQGPEASQRVLAALGLEFGASIQRRWDALPPDPERDAFLDVIAGGFDG
jgi:hypothetical protein